MNLIRAIFLLLCSLVSRKPGYFTLVIKEPLSDRETVRRVPIIPGQTLFRYLHGGRGWKSISSVESLARRSRPAPLHGWHFHIPRRNETLRLLPDVGVKSFTQPYIDRLNRDTEQGIFFWALILTETTSPLKKRYFVDHDRPITFAGNTYQPIAMALSDYEISRTMQLPSVRVSIPNFGQRVEVETGVFRGAVDYVEEIDVLEHDVTLQLLHLNLLGDANAKDETALKIQSIEGDDSVAVFTLGVGAGQDDLLPPKVVTRKVFPGVMSTNTKWAA